MNSYSSEYFNFLYLDEILDFVVRANRDVNHVTIKFLGLFKLVKNVLHFLQCDRGQRGILNGGNDICLPSGVLKWREHCSSIHLP